MNTKVLKAEPRTSTGKNNCNRLRCDGFIPAVVYSHGKSEAIKIQEKDFSSLFKGHISESVIFDLQIDGEEELMAFVKDFQRDPVTSKILHLDLFRVTKGEKIKTHVPIELVGVPAGLKVGGVLKQVEREIFIQCIPRNLPEKITIDISALMPGESIHVGDIKHGEELEILTSSNNVVVAVEKKKAETEEAVSTESAVAVAEADPGKE
jgi:large subunit ribosomal protein L25